TRGPAGSGRIGNPVRAAHAGRHGGPQTCIRTQVGCATVPLTVGEDVGIGQRCRAAGSHIPERSDLDRLVMVLTPLEIVDRSGSSRVVGVSVGSTAKRGGGVICIARMMAVGIPVQPPAGEVKDPLERLPWGR